MSVTVTSVSKVFGNGLRAIDEVSFSVANSEFVALLGASGCGKSTLLRLIAGLDTPTTGNIIAESDIGFVFQDATLLEWRSVFDNIYLPLQIKGAPFGLIYADKLGPGALGLDEKELALLRTLRNQAVMAFRQSN
jgi:ABC-type nitrate/sulfonate/bicarbonate transport system ATPase subunit